jgi:hypothetical protein
LASGSTSDAPDAAFTVDTDSLTADLDLRVEDRRSATVPHSTVAAGSAAVDSTVADSTAVDLADTWVAVADKLGELGSDPDFLASATHQGLMLESGSVQRKNITVRVSRTPAEAERADRDFLQQLTPADRILLTWQLSKEQWELKGVGESRLSRHHTRLIRR